MFLFHNIEIKCLKLRYSVPIFGVFQKLVWCSEKFRECVFIYFCILKTIKGANSSQSKQKQKTKTLPSAIL